jgi:HSP90 family molecular chaperone
LQAENDTANIQELIGQFGVGFYSTFLVSTKVVVTSKRYNESQYIWSSVDAKSFTVEEDKSGESLGRGTKVTLYLNDDTQFLQFSNTTRVREIATRYSQFIDFPIYLRVEQEDKSSRHKPRKEEDDEDDEEAKKEEEEEDVEYVAPSYNYEHINQKKAIWLRDPDDEKDKEILLDEDYLAFFKEIGSDFKEDPVLIFSIYLL